LIRLISQKGHQGVILRGSESGLWQARLTDNTHIDAASFSTTSAQRQFRWENDAPAHALCMSYRSPGLTVTVTATCREDGVELVADVTPHEKTLLEFALPGRLRFDPDELQMKRAIGLPCLVIEPSRSVASPELRHLGVSPQ
jgi:hypothetical protein